MIPRKKLDIHRPDFTFGFLAFARPLNRGQLERQIESCLTDDGNGFTCLSVRTGLDLVLKALNFPRGSEIMVSAVTIRDMARIIRHHGLVPVPVDLNMATLAIERHALESAYSPRTKALLIAHLFGSQMPVDPLIPFVRERGLLLFEDCAQAYIGDSFRGHPESDVVMFSFGPIKTNTALGGAVLLFRDLALLRKVRASYVSYPLQKRGHYLARLLKYFFLSALTTPQRFEAFVRIVKLLGGNHDELISAATRGFAVPDFFRMVRQQPCTPLLALLERKLTKFDSQAIDDRREIGLRARRHLKSVQIPGDFARNHTYWVFPVQVEAPDDLKEYLWEHGFDATRGASSLYAVPPPETAPHLEAFEATASMQGLLYLPVYPEMDPCDFDDLIETVNRYRVVHSGAAAHV